MINITFLSHGLSDTTAHYPLKHNHQLYRVIKVSILLKILSSNSCQLTSNATILLFSSLMTDREKLVAPLNSSVVLGLIELL